jgi:dipeptidyl aminopeptidase/acylaminoacyl peptidase
MKSTGRANISGNKSSALTVFSGVAALLLTLGTPLVSEAKSSDKRLLTIEDFTAFTRLANPTHSPDDRWLAYVASQNDFASNSTIDRIWMSPTDGGDAIAMTSTEQSSWDPVFSKDGKRLYFLSARGEQGITQLWSLNLAVGGEAQQLTKLERDADQIRLSPDESQLLLVLADEPTEQALVEGAEPSVTDRLQFKADYIGYLNRQRDHIYTLDLASAELTQITNGDYDDYEPAWSPDGKQIVFVSNRTEEPDANFNSDLWLVNADGSKLKQLTNNPAADMTPVWHPNGESLAYLAMQPEMEHNYAMPTLSRLDIASGSSRYLTREIDRYISQPKFDRSGNTLFFLIEDSAEQHLGKLDWKTEQISRPVQQQAVVTSYAVNSRNIASVALTRDNIPVELYLADKEALAPITAVNADLTAKLKLGNTRSFTFTAHDGLEIEALATFPPGFRKGKRYPTLLRIHGGPVAQFDHAFSFEAQLLASNGYVVIRANPRGSSGYGQDFAMGLYQGWGEKDYRDVMGAVDYAIAQGWSDPERLGMGGFSYGGILTNYLLGQTDRFKAAVSGAGSGSYLASYGHDEYQHWYESELGLPWENRELWQRLSPFTYIHKATTPTLFAGGAIDWNVPIQGSEQLYQVMKRQGIDTQLVVYPGEHHGGWAFANEMDFWHRTLAWYARYLK